MSNTETYAERVDRVAAELLDVLRDVLGPERCLLRPRAAYARYGDHSVTVCDSAPDDGGHRQGVLGPPYSRRPGAAAVLSRRPREDRLLGVS